MSQGGRKLCNPQTGLSPPQPRTKCLGGGAADVPAFTHGSRAWPLLRPVWLGATREPQLEDELGKHQGLLRPHSYRPGPRQKPEPSPKSSWPYPRLHCFPPFLTSAPLPSLAALPASCLSAHQ